MIASNTTTKPIPPSMASHHMVDRRGAGVRIGVTNCRGGAEAGASGLIAGDAWLRSIGRVFIVALGPVEAGSGRTAAVFAAALRTGAVDFRLVDRGANRG